MENIDMALFQERLRTICKKRKITHKKLSELTGTPLDTVNAWFRTNETLLPSLNKMYRISKVLGVSIDYFVNPDMDCLTVSNQMINDYTGLSDNAIHNLYADKKEIEKYGISRYHHIDIINFLLSDQDGAIMLSSVYEYLFGNYVKTKDGNPHIDLLDETEIPCNGGSLTINDINAYFLTSIVQNLSQIKGSLKKDPAAKYKYYGKFNPENKNEMQVLFSNISSFKK